jgi:hypothetical protein
MNMANRIVILAMVLATCLTRLGYAHNYLPAPEGSAVTIIPDISVSRAAYRSSTSR